MSDLLRDLHIGLRALRKATGFTSLAVAVLAIGVALSTTAFAIVDGALRKPLPYPEADRLVMICDAPRADPSRCGVVAPGTLQEWQRTSAFESIALVNLVSLTITADDGAERVAGSIVTPGYFDVVRTVPVLGRRPAPQGPGGPRDILLSHAFWVDRFGSAPDVVGRTLQTGSGDYTVAGVMPTGYRGPEEYLLGRSRFWLVFPSSLEAEGRGARYLRSIARLSAGVPLAEAAQRIAATSDRLSAAYPETNAAWTSAVVPLHQEIVRDARPTLRLSAVAVALVQVIVCANLASLLLSRGLRRQRELAVRAALGAGRARVIAGILAEALIIAAAGAAAGLLGAIWLLSPAMALMPSLPRTEAMAVDGTAAAFAFALAAVTAIVASIAPAVAALNVPPGLALQDTARFASEGPVRRRLRRALVGAEMAVSMTLLAGAGLLARTFVNVMAIDPGYHAQGVLMARVDLPAPPRDGRAIRDAAAAVGRIPGVSEAGFVSSLPLYPLNDVGVMAVIEAPRQTLKLDAKYRAVTPGYFGAMGLRAVAGRLLQRADAAGADPAVVINEVAAARFAAGPPIGGRLSFQFGDRAFTGAIVGVVEGSRSRDLMLAPEPEFYVAYDQHPVMPTMFLAARAGPGRRDDVTRALRPALVAVAPGLSIEEIQPFQNLVDRGAAASRRNMILVGVLAAAALLLSAVGLYAVVAHSAMLRGREMAIRLALGEPGERIRRLVVRDGLQLAAIGIVAGTAAAYVLTILLGTRLFGVGPHDPLTFISVSLGLVVVALAASYLPARRAARVDPVIVLREDG